MRLKWTVCAVTGLAVALGLLADQRAANAGQTAFSALEVRSASGEKPVEMRVFISDGRTRLERGQGDQQRIEITDAGQGVRWLLNPGVKEYTEQRMSRAGPGMQPGKRRPSLPGEAGSPCGQGGISCKQLGTEQRNGRTAEKWEILMARGQQSMRLLVWIDRTATIPVVRQEFPGGETEDVRYLGKEQVNGRETEKWETTWSKQQQTMRLTRWMDRELGIPIREQRSDGYVRELRNVRVGPQAAAIFAVPPGYRRIEMPPQQPARGQFGGGQAQGVPPASGQRPGYGQRGWQQPNR